MLALRGLLLLLVLVVQTGCQKIPVSVNINMPVLTKTSEYLATAYERDNLDKSFQKADEMVLLDALAQRTTVNVKTKGKAALPFAGGMDIVIPKVESVSGNNYYLACMVEQRSNSYAMRKMDPWPMWQLLLGKLFHSDSGKVHVVQYSTVSRDSIPLSSPSAQSAIKVRDTDPLTTLTRHSPLSPHSHCYTLP
jgi:hypothetical protein